MGKIYKDESLFLFCHFKNIWILNNTPKIVLMCDEAELVQDKFDSGYCD